MSRLLDQFECVRIVRMNGIDLNQFQFDYDQTWAAVFLRPNGTVIARYGTRADMDKMSVNSLTGLTHTMQQVIEANRAWDARAERAYGDKVGPPASFSTANEIPSPTIRKILARENQQQSCIHCHNVYDGQREVAIQQGTYDPRERWKYPLPTNIGLEVDPTSATTVRNVLPGSSAEQAGVQPGDVIRSMNGQPIHSVADLQFVLHHLKAVDTVQIAFVEGPDRTLQLTAGWREGDIGWRASMYGMPPRPGLWVQAASPEEKHDLGIPHDRLALKVRGTFGEEVRRDGLKKGDIIVQFGEETSHHTEGQFHAKLRLDYYRPQAKLPLRLLRDGEPLNLIVTFENTSG